MRRVILAALLAALVASAAPEAPAAGAYGKYLPPNQAFRLSARVTPRHVVLTWQIATHYYLYRDKFDVRATRGMIGSARLPPGEPEDDPAFGRVEIYRHEVRITVPYRESHEGGPLALSVSYQGCAENGICYPPITRHLDLDTEAAKYAVGHRTGAR